MSKPFRTIARSPYICTQCLSKHYRRFSTAPRLRSTSAPPPPPTSGYAELTHRSLISLSGVDAPKFLQGLTTNNVDPSRTSGWYSGFLNATGRVLWDTFIYPYSTSDGEKSYLIEVDEGEIKSIMGHLKRHKLRSKITIRDVRGDWRIWSVWQDHDATTPYTPSDPKSLPKADQITLPDPRLSSLGHRILLSPKLGPPSQVHPYYESLTETALASYTLRRYLSGIPEGQEEILRESALPLESNMDYLSGIDFRKGCYVGQELTIRTQHTGVVRKRILPIQLYTSAVPDTLAYDPADAVGDVEIQPRTDIKGAVGRPTGKYLKSVGNIGLALCRLENMTDLRVSAEGGVWKEGMEFSFAAGQNGERVKVKAFIPDWLREKEREKTEKRGKLREEL